MKAGYSNRNAAARVCPPAFTLIELLTVIAIIGLLAAITAPTIQHFRKGDATLSATRQMLDEVARARQLAISQHTTVYMVFVPTNFWATSAFNNGTAPQLTANDLRAATNLLDRQLSGYTFVTLRSLGDQPGKGHPHYLTSWKSLPDNSFIAEHKFQISPNKFYQITTNVPPAGPLNVVVFGFDTTTNVPFPLPETKPFVGGPAYPQLPYIAFNYLGQLTTVDTTPAPALRDAFIPLAHGSVVPAINGQIGNHPRIFGSPDVQESPPGNSTNAFNLIHIDALTGRARLEHREIQ